MSSKIRNCWPSLEAVALRRPKWGGKVLTERWHSAGLKAHHGVSVRRALAVVLSSLSGRHDVALRFDGAASQERLPVGRSCRHGERRRIRQHLGPAPRQTQAELGKAQVVTLVGKNPTKSVHFDSICERFRAENLH